METITIRFKDLGPLHDLLLRACPPNDEGIKSIPVLAEAIGFTAFGVYKWIKPGRISPENAKKVVAAQEAAIEAGKAIPEEDRVKLEDFYPYIFA